MTLTPRRLITLSVLLIYRKQRRCWLMKVKSGVYNQPHDMFRYVNWRCLAYHANLPAPDMVPSPSPACKPPHPAGGVTANTPSEPPVRLIGPLAALLMELIS